VAGAGPRAGQGGAGGAFPGPLSGANRLGASVANASTTVRKGLNAAGQQALVALKARIVAVLELRKARFDLAAVRVSARIVRVSALADRVGAAGQDVSGVKSGLSGAQSHLDSAKSLEAQAVAAFQAVPNATNKRAAFIAARELGRRAGAELRSARTELRAAITELRAIIQKLKESASATGSTSVQ
jgi:hypothetical protein